VRSRAPVLVAVAAVWLWLACDGRLHWDEPSYLYIGAFLPVQAIFAGEFQPSTIEGFTLSRTGHILFIKLITSIFGPGLLALTVLRGFYVLLLFLFLGLTARIVHTLIPSMRVPWTATGLVAFSPIFLYLAWKTLPEIPAAVCAALAVWALLRALEASQARWLPLVAVALVAVALTKNVVGVLYGAFVVALLAFGGFRYPLHKVLLYTGLTGVGALGLFGVTLWVTGISPERYFAFIGLAGQLAKPVEMKILATSLEWGLLWLAVLGAWCSPHKREVGFFTLWLALTTLPFLLMLNHVEERYLISNFIALTGLAHLAIEALRPKLTAWWRTQRALSLVVYGLGAGLMLTSAAVAQPLMMHEVQTNHLDRLLHRLDSLHKAHHYAILTPVEYTTFFYLRFAYPQRDVYNVKTRPNTDWAAGGITATDGVGSQNRFYGARALHTIEQVRALHTDLVYLGYESTFPVANLRALARQVPLARVQRIIDAKLHRIVSTPNRMEQSWLWSHPSVTFQELARQGHYIAMRVVLQPPRSLIHTHAAR
jgi:Dolichyl-phosphate-mannose-protein mannosyltransferase